MSVTKREKELYGSDVEIVRREENCTVFRIANDSGDVVMTSFEVFPGIHLVYNDVHIRQCGIERADIGDIIEINHCREGRIECEFRNEFFYLCQGDVSISRKKDAGHDSYFPGSHYHGISIMIDVERTPDCLSCFLKDVDVRPSALIDKFCSGNTCFVMRAKPELEHVFSELYSVPESIRKGYFKVKVLEILLFLSGVDSCDEQSERMSVPKSKVILAKRVCRYLTEHMDSRFTVDQLSEYFHVSGTQIKNSFKSVYGTSMYSFVRTQKMQEAALMLKRSNRTILDIAGQFGYDNGSKFAKAFRDVMGVSPAEYREVEKSPNGAFFTFLEWRRLC